MKNNNQLLFDTENHWKSVMGAWFPGERVVMRGKDLLNDLLVKQKTGAFDLFIYSITGRSFTKQQMNILNSIWVSTNFPDPRLWNNRVATLAGTARSTGTLGISAAVAISEASIYGHMPNIRASDFFHRAGKLLDMGENIETIVTNEMKKFRGIYGYGRPITREDERVPRLMEVVTENNHDNGKFVTIAFAVEEVLRKGKWKLHMNVTGLAAALTADMGFTAKEHYLYAVPCFIAGMIPCLIEAHGKPEGSFFPIRCTTIKNQGTAKRRTW